MNSKFSDEDLQQFASMGLTPEKVEQQIENFRKGFPKTHLIDAATIDNKGIIRMSDNDIRRYAAAYKSRSKGKRLLKFVPASGAASRMFKMLFGLLNDYDGSEESYKKLFSKDGLHSAKKFIDDIQKFAFYEDLKSALQKDGFDIDELLKTKNYHPIFEYLLTEKGLNYGNLPKGLLLFHKYENENRTPLEEHLVEGATYAKAKNNDVNLHFTVSPEFIQGFKDKVSEVKDKYQSEFKAKFFIDYSVQKPTTDTIAVNADNTPFLNADGSLLFRPAGHGALIENLNELNYDIIFIKNIDNIVPDAFKEPTVLYKKALAGILIKYQKRP